MILKMDKTELSTLTKLVSLIEIMKLNVDLLIKIDPPMHTREHEDEWIKLFTNIKNKFFI